MVALLRVLAFMLVFCALLVVDVLFDEADGALRINASRAALVCCFKKKVKI